MHSVVLKNASEIAAELLRDAILYGRFEPGQRLKEEHLARELGISRTPVREALMILQTEGFVDLAPNRGASVRSYDLPDLTELYQLRALLEGYAARRAALLITEESIDDLKESCTRFTKLLPLEGGLPELVRENQVFHNVILEASQAPRLMAMVRSLELPLVYTSYVWRQPEEKLASDRYHKRIVAALEDQKPLEAERLMKEHVFHARDVLMDELGARRRGDGQITAQKGTDRPPPPSPDETDQVT